MIEYTPYAVLLRCAGAEPRGEPLDRGAILPRVEALPERVRRSTEGGQGEYGGYGNQRTCDALERKLFAGRGDAAVYAISAAAMRGGGGGLMEGRK